MDNSCPLTDEDLMVLAVQSIDWSDQNFRRDPSRAILTQSLRLRGEFRADSLTRRVLASTPIPATLVSAELEQTSNRYYVEFRPLGRNPDGSERDIEHARTDRTDGRGGMRVAAVCSTLKVGERYIVHKTTESGSDGKKHRVMTWIEKIR